MKRWVEWGIVYGIPIAILLYVLYMNFLPFGYSETFVLDVGAEGDSDNTKDVYLLENPERISKPAIEGRYILDAQNYFFVRIPRSLEGHDSWVSVHFYPEDTRSNLILSNRLDNGTLVLGELVGEEYIFNTSNIKKDENYIRFIIDVRDLSGGREYEPRLIKTIQVRYWR